MHRVRGLKIAPNRKIAISKLEEHTQYLHMHMVSGQAEDLSLPWQASDADCGIQTIGCRAEQLIVADNLLNTSLCSRFATVTRAGRVRCDHQAQNADLQAS